MSRICLNLFPLKTPAGNIQILHFISDHSTLMWLNERYSLSVALSAAASSDLPPLYLQYSLPVLPCGRGAALPLCVAAHLHPCAAVGHAGHRVHPHPVPGGPAVQLPAPAH